MSINFNDEVNDDVLEEMKRFFGKDTPMDRKTALIDTSVIDQKEMKKLANMSNQPVSVELHGEGEIKTLADGTRYQVTERGWRKLDTTDYPY